MNFDILDTEKTAKEFRQYRLNKIENEEVWSPMSKGPYYVLHWLPILENVLFNPDSIKSMEFSKFIRMERFGYEKKLNADGVRFYSTEKDEIRKPRIVPNKGQKLRYFWNAQIFRSGALEMAFALTFFDDSPVTKWIDPSDITEKFWDVMDGFKDCMSHFNVTAPIMVGVSLLRVRGYRLAFDEHERFRSGDRSPREPSDREQIILQEVMENLQNTEKIERSIFDTLWQAFGLSECEYYDENGKRKSIK